LRKIYKATVLFTSAVVFKWKHHIISGVIVNMLTLSVVDCGV